MPAESSHQQHRQAAGARRSGCDRGTKAVVSDMGKRGEDLLSVDNPVVAVPLGRVAQARHLIRRPVRCSQGRSGSRRRDTGRILAFSSSEPVALIAFAGSIVVPGPIVGTPPCAGCPTALRLEWVEAGAALLDRPGRREPTALTELRVSAPVGTVSGATLVLDHLAGDVRSDEFIGIASMGAQFAGSVKSIRSATSRDSGPKRLSARTKLAPGSANATAQALARR